MGRDSTAGVTWLEERITGLEGEKFAIGFGPSCYFVEPTKQSGDTQAEVENLRRREDFACRR